MTTSPKITARIKKPLKNDALYVFIDNYEDKTMTSWAVVEKELPAIRDAIDSYLKQKEV